MLNACSKSSCLRVLQICGTLAKMRNAQKGGRTPAQPGTRLVLGAVAGRRLRLRLPRRQAGCALADLPDVDAAAVLTHIKTLASDAFEGRAPGSRGETKTVAYLIDQFKTMGLASGTADGSFTQKVPLVGITAAGAPLVLKKGAADHAPEVEGRVRRLDEARRGHREPQ